jgi:hypothetical protein
MKVHYQITSDETGLVLLRNRKIAKALECWLSENGFSFRDEFFVPRSFYLFRGTDSFRIKKD